MAKEKSYTAAVVYGSHFYGQSRDNDKVWLVVYGDRGRRLLANVPDVGYQKGDDLFNLNQRPSHRPHPDWWGRVVAQCLIEEYSWAEELLSDFPVMSLELLESLGRHTSIRRALAQHFPCPFTVARGLFATVQCELYKSHGVFLDSKEKVLRHYDGPVDAARRLLYYQSDEDDLRVIYHALFQSEYPSEVWSYQTKDKIFVWRNGTIFVSDYSSFTYGWSEEYPISSPCIEPYGELMHEWWEEEETNESNK